VKVTFKFEYNKKNEFNGKYYVEIPENLWEKFNQRGRIKSESTINGYTQITSLIPKGEGKYVFHLTKKMIDKSKIEDGQVLGVEIKKIEKENNVILEALTENRLNKIKFRKQTTSSSCGQACIAMLLDKDIDDIFQLVGKRPLAIGRIVETLNSHGVKNAQKNIRISMKNPRPSELSILTLKQDSKSHYVLYVKGKFYDPSRGVLSDIPTGMKLSLYLEIDIA